MIHARTILSGLLLTLLAAILPGPLAAQDFPKLTGRVVDAAKVIPADVEARLDGKLAALEAQSQRQLVVTTIPSLQGYDIADYGYRLGRAWGIGDKKRNDGALLIVAPTERKVRIEVGYGLEAVLTDGLSSLIVNQTIIPRFKAGDMPDGIEAGADAIVTQLTLPPDEAAKVVQRAEHRQADGGDVMTFVFFGVIFFLAFGVPALRAMLGPRRRYRNSGIGSVVLWSALDALSSARRSSGGGFSGGGFSGGGGSFGGGGSSGSW